MSYLGHSLGESNLSAEMQLVYSAAPVDWATSFFYLFTRPHIMIDLVSLFNGISTFLGYLMPMLFS